MWFWSVIPNNFLISTRNFSYSIINCWIPLNLFPNTLVPARLNKGEWNPSSWIRSITVAITIENSRMSGITKWTTVDGERNRCMWKSIVKFTPLPICSIVYLVIDEEWLFITTEICPCNIINCRVRSDFGWNRFGCSTIVNEHFSYFCIYIVSQIRTDCQILWEEELANHIITILVGKNIDSLESSGTITGPINMDLNR